MNRQIIPKEDIELVDEVGEITAEFDKADKAVD